MIEHADIINTLGSQIAAILDLIQCTNGNTDVEIIQVSAEMCVTMLDELMAETDKIFEERKIEKEVEG